MACPLLSVAVHIGVKRVAPVTPNKDVMVAKELLASSLALYLAIAVPVRKYENSSETAGSRNKRRLVTTTRPTTEPLENEGV